ncbi:TolC family protein [Rubrivirga sp. S365]|uniref:TolC family protein n=1 Tax=Rubrivirga litoralis TaxID=3075598 RepID=A0ABU3BPH9_9BACT|nr:MULTISPECIES: TolC family protein [unclassified Rubrivirga]MDT0631160.1 TolC family protein [Rubrivirga sp. F394]MDT7856697.1 TolC family protein [Rubrivirga sp. S365]
MPARDRPQSGGYRAGWLGIKAALALALLMVGGAAGAQELPSLRQDSIPPLPDSLRLYGATLPTQPPLPDFAAPAGAVRLTLDEAVTVALLQNPDRAVAVLEGARAVNNVTRGNAGYLPTLDATAGLAGSRSSTFGGGGADSVGLGGAGGTRSSTALDAGLTLGYTLYDGGLRAATYRRLQAEARRLALLADADAEALALDVAAAYLDAARQADLAAARAEAVAVSEDRLRIAQAEVRIGTSAEIDAALALADYNADRALLLREEVELAGARAELGGLLALPDPEAVVVTDTLALGAPPALDALVAEAGAGNRRVAAFQAAEAVAAQAVAQVRSDYRPTVRAAGGVGLTVFDRGFFPPALAPTVGPDLRYGVTASLPIYDGGERRRRLENARIDLRQAELLTASERLANAARAAGLASTARGFRALADLETLNERVARENVRVALAQLRLGFITPVDLRQIQLTLVDVRTRRVEAVYQARRAEAELRLLAGVLLPPGTAVAPTLLDGSDGPE